jgi:hypothetical protein
MAHGEVEFELESDPSSKSTRIFAEFPDEIARDYFGKRHEAGFRVGRHGEAVL